MAASHIFKIMFVNQGKVYEVYARKVGQGRLFGLSRSKSWFSGSVPSVVLDPGEERIKSEFKRRQVHHAADAIPSCASTK
jgi:hypothetical protein